MVLMPHLPRKVSLTIIVTLVSLCVLAVGIVLLQKLTPQPVEAQSTIWYVSRKGSNDDGKTWVTAWNDLNQINWSAVQSGDTILLDGGGTPCTYPTNVSGSSNTPRSSSGGSCGMVYQSTLTPGRSGVTIRLASESGRNGSVIIFGGRSIPLPYCDQAVYNYQIRGTGGISLGSYSGIVIDGTKWGGIKIYGGTNGISLSSTSRDNTIRNVEIYDEGIAEQSSGTWVPDQEGVGLKGTNIVFDRTLIHDNGQDDFQSGGGIQNITIRQSWVYNGRPHAIKGDTYSFNHCRHTDGIQIYNGGVQSGLLIEDSVFGPGFTQGTILGQSLLSQGQNAEINDVTIRNTLFINATGTNIMGYPNVKSKNWKLDRVTSFLTDRNPSGNSHNAIHLSGSGHSIVNSVFYGGIVYLPDGNIQTSGNCQWKTTGAVIGSSTDPQFTTSVSGYPDSVSLNTLINTDFTVKSGSCTGSSITSVAQLLGSQPPPPPTTPTPTPATPTPTPPLLSGLSFEAEAGAINSPFFVTGGYVSQSVETADPLQGGRASYRFAVTTPGDYVIVALVDAPSLGSNSFFVNIDGEPTSPGMIWDVDVTIGPEQRTVSWRGGETPEANEFVPKVFPLSAGTHELIIRGRERDTKIDRLSIVQVTQTPLCITGDINCDRVVNILDFQILSNNFGKTDPASDLNADGIVNILDFQILSNNFGRSQT